MAIESSAAGFDIRQTAKPRLAELILGHFSRLNGEGAGSIAASEIEKLLEKPPQSELGDYAFPCFRFAKAMGKSPGDLAAALAAALSGEAEADALVKPNAILIESAAAAGPFVNIRVRIEALAGPALGLLSTGGSGIMAKHLQGERDRAAGIPAGRVMIEYSQPNTHKEFHIGHARNVCLGNALIRIMRYCGADVIPVNYIGDEGTHIAKCIFQLEKDGIDVKGIKPDVSLLGAAYAKADAFLQEAPPAELEAAQKRISAILSGIESKTGRYHEMWLETRAWSMADFHRIYAVLDAHFDHYFYESEMSEESQAIVDEYLAKEVFVQSEGAIGIDLSDCKLGFLVLRKRDGNTLYATKDLVLHRRKFDDFKVEQSVVVVAEEQKHHFQQVFKTLERMGFRQAPRCQHLSYGMVVRPEGKMSSRKGNSVTFDGLLSQIEGGVAAVMEKNRAAWGEERFAGTVRRLAIGALKYGMLQADPTLRIVFDLESWLSFEGNTGPYLMYAYARTRSILRKAEEAGVQPVMDLAVHGRSQAERDLIRYMHDFDETVVQAAMMRRPSLVCHHLYNLCKTFGKFYVETPILKDADAQARAARVFLLACFSAQLQAGLRLLGIDPPEEM